LVKAFEIHQVRATVRRGRSFDALSRTIGLLTLLVFVWAASASAQPANDDCSAPVVVGSLPFSDSIDTTAATSAGSDPYHFCTSGTDSKSVWYSFTPATSGVVGIDTTGTTFSRVLAIYTGSCGALTEVTCSAFS